MIDKNKTGLNGQGSDQQILKTKVTFNNIYNLVEKHALIVIGPCVLTSIMIIVLTRSSLDLSIAISIFLGSYFGFLVGRKSLNSNQKFFDKR